MKAADDEPDRAYILFCALGDVRVAMLDKARPVSAVLDAQARLAAACLVHLPEVIDELVRRRRAMKPKQPPAKPKRGRKGKK